MMSNPEYTEQRFNQLEARIQHLERAHVENSKRIHGVEKHVHFPNVSMQEAACRAQATENLYAPLRSDTKSVIDLAAFARRLLEFDDLGQQCSATVRDAAREALGLTKKETV